MKNPPLLATNALRRPAVRAALNICAAGLLIAIAAAGFTGCSSRSVAQKDNVVDALNRKQLKKRERLPLEKRIKAVVLDFDDRSEFGKGRLGTAAANILSTFLSRSGQFVLYEREKLAGLYTEQSIKADGDIHNIDNAVRIGKTLSVNYILTGVVSNFGLRKTSSPSMAALISPIALLSKTVKQEAEATVDVRMIEVATGRIIASENGTGTVTIKTRTAVWSSTGYDETMSGDALRAAISQFVDVFIDEGLANR